MENLGHQYVGDGAQPLTCSLFPSSCLKSVFLVHGIAGGLNQRADSTG